MTEGKLDHASQSQMGLSFGSVLAAEWPYLAMLLFAIGGVGYTSISRQSMVLYWIVLTPIFGLICIFTGWRKQAAPEVQFELVRTQALHWLAVLAAMCLIFVPSLQKTMNSVASALMLLVLLALGTFTGGLLSRSWRVCFVGIVLALGVPALAWLELSTILILSAAVVIAVLFAIPFLRR